MVFQANVVKVLCGSDLRLMVPIRVLMIVVVKHQNLEEGLWVNLHIDYFLP